MNHAPKFRLGQIIKDQITGFTGVVTALTEWQSNCPRYTLKPMKLKDDVPVESRTFDVTHLQALTAEEKGLLGTGAIPDLERDYPTSRSEAKLGDTLSDRNTDLKGTAVGMSFDINGCVGYYVQPRELTRDHKTADIQVIWDLDVVLVTKAKVKAPPVTTGGDRPEPNRRGR